MILPRLVRSCADPHLRADAGMAECDGIDPGAGGHLRCLGLRRPVRLCCFGRVGGNAAWPRPASLPAWFAQDEVSHLGGAGGLKTIDRVLQVAVGARHAFVLAQMLDPGIQHESLDEAALLREVLEYAPLERTIPPPLARELPNRVEEPTAVFRPDLIFDGHQHSS